MIDLHTHTTESDGTLSPIELVDAALAAGLEALAITDHDTFSGYDEARPYAEAKGLPLVCGIELSTAWGVPKERTVHLLGYWLSSPPTQAFRDWLIGIQEARRDRNRRLAARLRELGMDVHVEEAEALGRNMTGRPHFARVLVAKGYCRDIEDAFDRFLDESAIAYVDRDEPSFAEGVRRINEGGGISSLAHPARLGRTAEDEDCIVATMAAMNVHAIEVWHTDHDRAVSERYLELSRKHDLLATGGSDFHGAVKPKVKLGVGPGHLAVPMSVLRQLRSARSQQSESPPRDQDSVVK